jgi:hypothetical protein
MTKARGAERAEEGPAREGLRTPERVETAPAALVAPFPAAAASAGEREGAESPGSRGGWSRVMRLPPLKRAVVLSELLGKPKGLSDERFP